MATMELKKETQRLLREHVNKVKGIEPVKRSVSLLLEKVQAQNASIRPGLKSETSDQIVLEIDDTDLELSSRITRKIKRTTESHQKPNRKELEDLTIDTDLTLDISDEKGNEIQIQKNNRPSHKTYAKVRIPIDSSITFETQEPSFQEKETKEENVQTIQETNRVEEKENRTFGQEESKKEKDSEEKQKEKEKEKEREKEKENEREKEKENEREKVKENERQKEKEKEKEREEEIEEGESKEGRTPQISESQTESPNENSKQEDSNQPRKIKKRKQSAIEDEEDEESQGLPDFERDSQESKDGFEDEENEEEDDDEFRRQYKKRKERKRMRKLFLKKGGLRMDDSVFFNDEMTQFNLFNDRTTGSESPQLRLNEPTSLPLSFSSSQDIDDLSDLSKIPIKRRRTHLNADSSSSLCGTSDNSLGISFYSEDSNSSSSSFLSTKSTSRSNSQPKQSKRSISNKSSSTLNPSNSTDENSQNSLLGSFSSQS